MRKFRVSEKNLFAFEDLMMKNNPTEFAYTKHKFLKDRDYDGVYVEITFYNKKELKRLMKDELIPVIGERYEVIGGKEKSETLGYVWYYHVGEIIECIDVYSMGEVNFKSLDDGETQTMRIENLKHLIKEC